MTTMSRLAQLIVVLVAGLVLAHAALAQALEIIDLRHRFADEVIPAIQPLVEPGGVLTGSDNKLFLRASPANVAQIRQAIAAIDRARRQLRITVGQGTSGSSNAAGIRGEVVGGNAAIEAGAGSRQANVRNVSSVQTLEGNETLISVGTSVPITTRSVTSNRGGGQVRQSTEFRDVSTGFYATPRVSGDRVILEISPRQQRQRSARGGVVETSGATTTVSGRLGDWIELGAVSGSDASATGGLLVWGRRTGSSEYSAWVKVEEVPATH